MKCSICNDDIDYQPISQWARGHNAQPLNDGRCCSICNDTIVIPARIALLFRETRRAEEVSPTKSK